MKNAVFWDVAPCVFLINGRSSETSVYNKLSRPHIPEGGILRSHRSKGFEVFTVVKTSNPTTLYDVSNTMYNLKLDIIRDFKNIKWNI
jgi:hypothetical protein